MSVRHVVKQGEYLSIIAAKYGFTWKELYEHPDNAEFRRKRPDPNTIYPGDEVAIPSLRPKSVACQTGRTHRFVVKRKPDELVLELSTMRGGKLAGVACEVDVVDAHGVSLTPEPLKTKTSGTGELRLPLPSGAAKARVTALCEPPIRWYVAIGHLDPVRDASKAFDPAACLVTGIQARLNNLGFLCGAVDGVLGPKTRKAIASFQRRVLRRSTADGTLDGETCSQLVSEHGC